MITPERFRPFFFLLLASFFFGWMGIVVLPWMELGQLAPVPGDSNDITPWDFSGEAHQGERVYAANGCAYCHTQQVRAATSGADLIRGWGTAKDADGQEVKRRTYPRDYIWQRLVFLGNSRNGADLSNLAERYPDAEKLYSYLYNPMATTPNTSMPAYKFLFTTHKIDGLPSQEALALTGPGAPSIGYEVVPTVQAKSLVAYLLSLKKGYHLPDETPGPVVIPSKEGP